MYSQDKIEKKIEKNKSFTLNFYKSRKYNNKKRLFSYAIQIDTILSLNSQKILEVGLGSGYVTTVLRFFNKNVTTVDMLSDLYPDIVANIKVLPFEENEFDTTVCCEVLEHMPYEAVMTALTKLKRVTSKNNFLTLPDASRKLVFQIPKLGKKTISLPMKSSKISEDHSHFLELKRKGYSLKKFMSDLKENNFTIKQHGVMPENTYHHFFVLECKH